jgi:hypothetical protein
VFDFEVVIEFGLVLGGERAGLLALDEILANPKKGAEND